VSKRWKGVGARGREGEGKRAREREGQLANSWLVVVGPPARRRHPGAEVTLCNNSFCFMSWVVYTLCLPRDRHAARGAGRGGSGGVSHFRCPRSSRKLAGSPPLSVVYGDSSYA